MNSFVSWYRNRLILLALIISLGVISLSHCRGNGIVKADNDGYWYLIVYLKLYNPETMVMENHAICDGNIYWDAPSLETAMTDITTKGYRFGTYRVSSDKILLIKTMYHEHP